MQKLRDLQISDIFNGEDTSIPDELGSLENLEVLVLNGLKLNTPIPNSLGNLFFLRELDLRRNQLSHDIPSELGSALSLSRMELGDNAFTQFPSGLTSITSLTWLNLERNMITDVHPNIKDLINLENLNMRTNQVKELPDELWRTPNLSVALFNENEISGALSDSLINAQGLTRLLLGDNNITSVTANLGSLNNLNDLQLDNNPLTLADLVPFISVTKFTVDLLYEPMQDTLVFATGQGLTLQEDFLLDSATDFVLLKGEDSIFLGTDENLSPYRKNDEVVFNQINLEDIGLYQIIAEHDSFPFLTLEGRQFEIRDGSNAITMTQILDQTKPKNNLIRNLGFTVTYIDGFTPTNQVVTVSSDNEALIAAEDFQIDVTSSGYNLSVTPKTDAFGTATIGVVVADGPFKDSISFNIEVLDIVLSTDEVLLSGFSLAPNPTSATATLTIDNSYTGAVQVNVLSMQGKLLGSTPLFKTGTSLTSTLVGHLSPGAYLVEVIMDDVRMVERLVVE